MAVAAAGKAPKRSAQLSTEQIVAAALRIIQLDGVEALSMRRLSRELDVTPMAAYYYVADKGALLDLVVDAVLAQVKVPGPEAGRWDKRLRILVDRIDEEVRAHPGLGPVLLDGLLSSRRELLDATLQLLQEAGFDERGVLMAYATIHSYLFGRHKIIMAPPERDSVSDVPFIARMNAHLETVSGRDYYEFGVETVIQGLKAQLRAARRKS